MTCGIVWVRVRMKGQTRAFFPQDRRWYRRSTNLNSDFKGLQGPPSVGPLVSPLEASKRAENACEVSLQRFYGDAERARWRRENRKAVLRRRAEGVCYMCGKTTPNLGNVTCGDCGRKANARHVRTENVRKAAGLCADCGKIPPVDGVTVSGAVRVTCDPCGKKRSAKVLRSVENRRRANEASDAR